MKTTIINYVEELYSLLHGQKIYEHDTDTMVKLVKALDLALRNSEPPQRLKSLIEKLHRKSGNLLRGRDTFVALLELLQAEVADDAPIAGIVEKRDASVYFLSYSHKEISVADHLEKLLHTKGRKVWRDIKNLAIGDDHLRVISTQIERCHTFVALWAGAYEASDYCKGELQRALLRQNEGAPAPRRIVLLRLDDTDLPLNIGARNPAWARTAEERQEVVTRLVEQECS